MAQIIFLNVESAPHSYAHVHTPTNTTASYTHTHTLFRTASTPFGICPLQIAACKDKVLYGAPKRTEKITFVMIIYFARGLHLPLEGSISLRFKLANNFYFHLFSFRKIKHIFVFFHFGWRSTAARRNLS